MWKNLSNFLIATVFESLHFHFHTFVNSVITELNYVVVGLTKKCRRKQQQQQQQQQQNV